MRRLDQHPPGQDQVVEQGRQAINDRCFDARSPGGETRRHCVERRLGSAAEPAGTQSSWSAHCSLNEFTSLRTCKSGGCCSFSAQPRKQITGSEQIPPEHTSECAEQHDQSVLRCLSSILQMDRLPLHTQKQHPCP